MGGTALGASGRSNNGLKLDVKTGKLSLWRLFPTFTFTFTSSPYGLSPRRHGPQASSFCDPGWQVADSAQSLPARRPAIASAAAPRATSSEAVAGWLAAWGRVAEEQGCQVPPRTPQHSQQSLSSGVLLGSPPTAPLGIGTPPCTAAVPAFSVSLGGSSSGGFRESWTAVLPYLEPSSAGNSSCSSSPAAGSGDSCIGIR